MTFLRRKPQLLTLVSGYADLSPIIFPSAQMLPFCFLNMTSFPHLWPWPCWSLCLEYFAQIHHGDVTFPSRLTTILKRPHTHLPDLLLLNLIYFFHRTNHFL